MIPVKYYYSSSSSAPTASSLGAGGILFNSNNKYIYFTPDGTNLVTYQGTDKRVSMTRSTTSSYRALLMHPTYGEYGTDPGSATSSVYYHENIMASPQNGSIKATKFIGALEGNADTATSANKLTTDAGSVTRPVYFSDGKPTACSYSLNKTVPADAKFTDTVYPLDRIACKTYEFPHTYNGSGVPLPDGTCPYKDFAVLGIVTSVKLECTGSVNSASYRVTYYNASVGNDFNLQGNVRVTMTSADVVAEGAVNVTIYYIPVWSTT